MQDLTTGQKVFLDPRFNLSSYGAMPAAGLASCSAVATAGTTFGTAATGPAASQQRELQVWTGLLAVQASFGAPAHAFPHLAACRPISNVSAG